MKEKINWPTRECKTCKSMFQPYTKNQIYCQAPCTARTKKSLEEINAAWALRTEEDRKRQYKGGRNNFINSSLRLV